MGSIEKVLQPHPARTRHATFRLSPLHELGRTLVGARTVTCRARNKALRVWTRKKELPLLSSYPRRKLSYRNSATGTTPLRLKVYRRILPCCLPSNTLAK